MTVRRRIALTIFLAGLVSALGVLAIVAITFQRIERERTYDRANAFLQRVVASQPHLLDLHASSPQELVGWMRNVLLFEPGSQLYLLANDGLVLASSSSKAMTTNLRVRLEPVQQASAFAMGGTRMPYVMGDDPEHMRSDAVITARALEGAVRPPNHAAAGYLYLVSQQPTDAGTNLVLYRSTLAAPALGLVLGVILVTTGLALWVVITVTRPLSSISRQVRDAARQGFATQTFPPAQVSTGSSRDEFWHLQQGFHAMLTTLRQQWERLRELDLFRREAVSNFSHDLRSPLTAATASLETLRQRWAGDALRDGDRQLVDVAMRNTRKAAELVRSLSDLALLDEPAFKLRPMVVDLAEVLDDIVQRFAARAAAQGVALAHDVVAGLGPVGHDAHAAVDIELFERAIANLVDNALKHTPAGGHVVLRTEHVGDALRITVSDSGSGIAEADLPHLFERLYQGRRHGEASVGGEQGKGLGLAIVKRIAELHGGTAELRSAGAQGTQVSLLLPRGR